MINSKAKPINLRLTIVLGLMTVVTACLGMSVTALGAESNTFEFGAELEACVAALNDELDLDGVNRVRHIVTDYDQKRSGYKLTISIKTFSEIRERQYAAICVVSGDSEPSHLSISEVRS